MTSDDEIEYDDEGRPEPPLASGEWETLNGFLDFQRATLAWKTSGLDADQLATTLPPSSMTLVGLMKHLAYVEDDWFSRALHDQPRSAPWGDVDWASTPDWDWESATTEPPDQVRALWEESVQRSRQSAREVYQREGLDALAARKWPDGRAPSLRWILTHMIEEYSRHNGHADLLREALDGQVGE